MLIVTPVAVLAAVYLAEYAVQGRLVNTIRFAADTLASVPSIVMGLFGFALFVETMGLGFSVLSGALALSFLMLPIVMRATEEAIRAVPQFIRWGSYGLGASKWQTVSRIVLPAALPRILTGLILAMGRAVGETAVVIFTMGQAIYMPPGAARSGPLHDGASVYARDGGHQHGRSLRDRAAVDGHDPHLQLVRPVACRPEQEAQGMTVMPAPGQTDAPLTGAAKFSVRDLDFYYGDFHALTGITIDVRENAVTAFIGPSGCGKSTFLRCLNRMNELIPGTRVDGHITLDGADIYGPGVDPVDLRRRVGMIFQQPNPFPMSIYDNVAFGPRLHGIKNKAQLDEIVEQALVRANLWKEVKDIMGRGGLTLSGGQQQRLCIARVLAVQPDVLLMDEPCSAIDPTSVQKVEDSWPASRVR